MGKDDTDWTTFFNENPKPVHFNESLLQIRKFCQKSATGRNQIALITV